MSEKLDSFCETFDMENILLQINNFCSYITM